LSRSSRAVALSFTAPTPAAVIFSNAAPSFDGDAPVAKTFNVSAPATAVTAVAASLLLPCIG